MNTSRCILSAAIVAATLFGASAHATTYQFRVSAQGVRPEPIVAPAAGELVALDTSDFGQLRVGQASTRTFRFTNTGDAPATEVQAVANHSDLTIDASACGTVGVPVEIAGQHSCDITVTYRPTQAGQLDGLLTVRGNFVRSPASLGLTGSAMQEAVGALSANTTADFGIVPLNTTATRQFTFRNSGNLAATGVSATITAAPGLAVASNTCGTVTAPISVPGGSTCQVTVSYGGNTSSRLSGAELRIVGAFTGSPSAIPLTGSIGPFDATGNWSSVHSSIVPLTASNLAFGTLVKNSSAEKTFYVRNTGTSGAMQVGFQLSGDSSQFRIAQVYRRSNAGGHGCIGGGVVSTDGQSASPCGTEAAGASIYVTVRYTPTTVGNHSITVTPTTNNGSTLPAPLLVTGSGQFNPTAAWSTWTNGYAAMGDGYANYASLAVGKTKDKSFTLANVGTHGPLSVGVVMTGDTSHFTITAINRSAPGGTSGCVGGGGVVAGGLSTTYCGADSAGTGIPHVTVWVRYSPKAKGNHSVTLTPITNNGSVLPAPVVLSGTGT